MAKKPSKKGRGPEPERLTLDVHWEEAARRLLRVPPKSAPPRPVKPRKKKSA